MRTRGCLYGKEEPGAAIFFIFLVGGAMAVLQETRAIEAGMGRLIRALKDKSIVIIPVVMLFFSLCGSVFGMAEETIPFIPIFVSLCLAMGFRIALYAAMVSLTILMILRYAMRVKKDPHRSLMYEEDRHREDVIDLRELPAFGGREKAILLVFLVTIGLLIWGVIEKGWYMNEIGALFLGMSFVVASIGRLGFNGYANVLGAGMAAIASGALVVGFARGILVVMYDGNILDTILHSAAMVLDRLPGMVSALGMYIFQCILSFIVPSGSGQAAVSIPILAPLGDLVGVTRQTSIIAYQLGDGISNILTPTSGYFMAGLALARIPWSKWVRWFLPLVGLQYLLGAIFVAAAQMMQLQ
ncbi:MAG: YfcC family protein [Anaerovoracaceae bacterium]